MQWIEVETIQDSIVAMFKTNMGLKPGERVLVVTDVTRPIDWQEKTLVQLAAMVTRSALARQVADITRRCFPDNPTEFLPFANTGSHGAEPEEKVARQMRQADVVIALTTYSLSHTNARAGVTAGGARLASMPEFEAGMLAPDGPMAVDYRQVAADCQKFADRLTAAHQVQVLAPSGTDLRFSLEGRPGKTDTGLYDSSGKWGNLPAGEAFAVPLEGSGHGRLVAPAGWFPHLMEDMVFQFEAGRVISITGGGSVGDDFRRFLALESNDPAAVARRNLAELGIGTNPNARKPDNVLEAEKIKGTVHIAIGDNLHMGGRVEADLHEDFVQPEVDLILDGTPVIKKGQWQI